MKTLQMENNKDDHKLDTLLMHQEASDSWVQTQIWETSDSTLGLGVDGNQWSVPLTHFKMYSLTAVTIVYQTWGRND